MSGILVTIAITFLAGAAEDGLSVFWVHFAERNSKLRHAIVAGFQALGLAVGAREVNKAWYLVVVFVIGYVAGGQVAFRIKERWFADSKERT